MTLFQTETQLQTWTWRGYPITYRHYGGQGTPIVFVHGFGASSIHWRKNLSVLGKAFRCYALDLIGFGGSAKPQPGNEIDYTFETWGAQIADFCQEVVGIPVVLVANSIGCIAAMQAAVTEPQISLGIINFNLSLRLLHEKKRHTLPWYRRWGAPMAQKLLSYPPVGRCFFRQIAKPNTVRKILQQAYNRHQAITEELVASLLSPAQDDGAAEVFMAFTNYSQGPLAEDLLPQLSCPVVIGWGTEDPWEPVKLAQQLAEFDSVKAFIPLPGLGHCPQDEAPEQVNPIIEKWVREYWAELPQI